MTLREKLGMIGAVGVIVLFFGGLAMVAYNNDKLEAQRKAYVDELAPQAGSAARTKAGNEYVDELSPQKH